MKRLISIISFTGMTFYMTSCNQSRSVNEGSITYQVPTDSELAEFISKIRAVDNHTHVNTINPDDKGSDALPLEVLLPFDIPARLRPESPDWVAATKAVYGFTGTELNEQNMKELMFAMEKVMKEKGEKFPEWVLDQTGIEVMLANRVAMGPGLSAPRFRWVSYVDALLFPLSTRAEAAASPDREKLFPLEEQHLRNYLMALNLSNLPATLDEYLEHVVNSTLETQKSGGCIAIKFEVAFLRSLDFEKVSQQKASAIYSRYTNDGVPSHEDYKILQDFLFRYIAREAGRLGMAIHIHAFSGPGNYYFAAGSDPLLLEPTFNDPELRNTKFVLIHGGGAFSQQTSAMLWKPNVYADISALTRIWSTEQLAFVLRDWLSQFPEKILFGTDAASFGPGLGWELGAWIATSSGRQALTIALSRMIGSNEVSRGRAMEIATMVMRTNAGNLYNLGLK